MTGENEEVTFEGLHVDKLCESFLNIIPPSPRRSFIGNTNNHINFLFLVHLVLNYVTELGQLKIVTCNNYRSYCP